MKKLIALFILTLLYTHSADLLAIEHHSQESAKVKITCQRKITSLGGGYSKDDFSVYFRGEKLRGASASSFKYLGGGYGKDNWKVFYQGMVVKEASASSFEYSEDGYGKDNWNVFYRGRVVER